MKLKKRFALSLRNNLRFIPDETFMRMCFKAKLRYNPDFEDPGTFNEKLQWCKLHYRNPELVRLADKYGVRSFVEERVGAKYLVPLYGVYESVEEIDLDELPERFVLKCTHDSQIRLCVRISQTLILRMPRSVCAQPFAAIGTGRAESGPIRG